MTDVSEMDPLVTSNPTPPPARRAESHSGDKKDDNPIKNTMDRDRIIKEGLEIKDAPHHAYVDCGDSRNVRVNRDQIISLSELCEQRLDYLERKAKDEKGDFTELEVIIRDVAPKVRKWANFLEGGHAPGENEHLTQADLDAVYGLLMDEVEQRGAMMGYEVFLHPTRHGWRPEAQQFGTSRRGVETPYTKYLATHGQSREKIAQDLEKWEGVRVGFEQALTGRGLRDRVFVRAGLDRVSMFRRDSSELRLHTEILHALEASDEPVIRNFIATHGHIQRVTDLLVSLDSPRERNIAIRAYHEAISKASAKRFQLKAGDLLKKHLERREAVWDEKGWMETAEENLKKLEGEGQPTREQRAEVDALRTDMTKVRDLLRGKRDEQGQLQGGFPARLQQLQESVLTLHTYTTDSEHNLVTIKADRDGHKTRLDSYTKGQLPVADVPQELIDLKTIADAVRMDLIAAQTASPPDTKVIRELQSRYQQALNSYNESKDRYLKSEQEQVNTLNGKIATIEGEISTKETGIRDGYKFIETEIPDYITTITDLRNRLTRLIIPPPPVAAHITPHIAQLTVQITHLNNTLAFLNGMLTGVPVATGVAAMSPVRKGQGETISTYATRYDFYLPQDQFRDIVVLPFEEDIKLYDEIKKGVHDEEREDKIKAVQLVRHIVGEDQQHEGTIGKTDARLLAEGQDGRTLTELRNTRNLAIVRDLICNHAEILGAKKLGEDNEGESLGIGDTLLWQRVFSDVFILQSYVEWSVRRGGLTIPPPPAARGAGADFNLENVNDDFRQIVIDKMTSNHIDFGQFLNYLVEKRLHDAGAKPEIQVNFREAEGVAVTGIVTYNNHNRIGPGATIFAVEDNAEFATSIRTKENPYYTSPSAEGEIDNIGVVDHSRSGFVHYLNITSPEHDPLTLDLVDAGAAAGAVPRKRNIPLSIHLRTTPSINGGRFQIYIQADPSLAGLGINRIGSLDRRWVNLLGLFDQISDKKYNNFADLETQIHNLLPNIPQAEVGKYILRSLGGYFMELSPTQRLSEFARFPDVAITAASFPSLTNAQLGFQRISLDSSGVVELVRTVGGATTTISIDSALEGTFNIAGADRRLNATEVEELIRLVGQNVFNIVRR